MRRGSEFLLLHRSIEDYWHVVAGVVEDGESFAEAARRELREETGLDTPIADLGMRQRYRVPDDMRAEYLAGVDEVAVETFIVNVPRDWEPVLNEEHDYYRWLSLSEATRIAHWPETKEALAIAAVRSV